MFYVNFKRFCEDLKTTPTAVTKQLGYSTSKVTAWKNGAIPKYEILFQLAKFFGKKVSNFFDEPADYLQTNEEPKEKIISLISADRQRLLGMYDMLTDMQKGEILGRLAMLTSSVSDDMEDKEMQISNDLIHLSKDNINEFSRNKS